MFELTNITKEFLHRKVFDNFKLTFESWESLCHYRSIRFW